MVGGRITNYSLKAIGHTEEANLDHFTETFQELGAKLVDRSHDSNLAEEMRGMATFASDPGLS